jgi:hypothetical protein
LWPREYQENTDLITSSRATSFSLTMLITRSNGYAIGNQGSATDMSQSEQIMALHGQDD